MKRAAAFVLVAATITACGSSEAMTTAPATKVVVGRSQFGSMLFNGKRQAIYVFSADSRRKSNCYGDCARAWPPVYTSGKPRAGGGVHTSLLGTARRKDGRLQVTYAGRPLYYYADEGPGQVLCHDVNLNGGIWKVVAPNGKPRA
jgi:predicted lipoprotein with Yx(FWY)xxD motif